MLEKYGRVVIISFISINIIKIEFCEESGMEIPVQGWKETV